MRILVCGSRTFDDWVRLVSFLSHFDPIDQIISGGANGADKLAAEYAERHKVCLKVVLPDWDNEGKAAGIKRNIRMLDLKPDVVVAFWDRKSRGTKHTISEANRRKIPTLIVYF